jgi:hypothetical protein
MRTHVKRSEEGLAYDRCSSNVDSQTVQSLHEGPPVNVESVLLTEYTLYATTTLKSVLILIV